jgi:hypothetical protein
MNEKFPEILDRFSNNQRLPQLFERHVMKATPTRNPKRALFQAATSTLIGALLLPGCSTTPGGAGAGASIVASTATATNIPRVGFLSDYDRLKPVSGLDGILCWKAGNTDWKQFDKVQIERILVSLKSGTNQGTVDPGDLKTLTDYFHAALVTAIQPTTQVVDKAGPGVLQLRFALTNLVPTGTMDSLTGTLVPYGFVAEAGSGVASGLPAGSTPYMGETGMQAQFRDGATGKVMGECADNEIGRKYAASVDKGAANATTTWINGYMDSFTSWSYAKDAFDKWATLFAERFNKLRGM